MLITGLLVYIVGVPAAVNVDVFTIYDLLVSNVLLLAGGLAVTLYVGWFRRDILKEMRFGIGGKGGGGSLDWSAYWVPVIRFVLPALLTALLVLGVINFVDGLRAL